MYIKNKAVAIREKYRKITEKSLFVEIPQEEQNEEEEHEHEYKFKQLAGAANNDGVDYEKYFYLLVVIRLIENENVKKFNICSNIEGVGPCEDLVVRVTYNCEDEEKEEAFFIQLKHVKSRCITVNSLAATEKSDYAASKYYQSYKILLHKNGDFDDPLLKGCKVENSTFVFYTNAQIPVGDDNYPTNSFCRELFETQLIPSNVFIINDTDRYNKLKTELAKNKSLIVEEEYGKDFLNKFVLFASQINIAQLKRLIEILIKRYTNCGTPVENITGAMKFYERHKKVWLSNYSFSNFEINFQGNKIKSSKFFQFYQNHDIRTKILVQFICQSNSNKVISVAKQLQAPNDYYVERKVMQYQNDQLGYVTTKELLKQDLVVIYAGPGIGKTWYLVQQAAEIKIMRPECFVIYAQLNNYSNYLHEMDLENGETMKEVAERFLAQISGVSTTGVDYNIFKYSLYQRNLMVIFLDGIDAIYPDYYNKVIEIVKTIRSEFNVKIWISTRSAIKRNVEIDLEISCCKLIKFDERDMKNYVEKYCQITEYSKAFLPLPQSFIGNNIAKSMLGVPRFCEVLAERIKKHLERKNKLDYKEKYNETELYAEFVNKTFEVFYKNIFQQRHDVISKAKAEEDKRKSLDLHSKAALLALSGNTRISKVLIDDLKTQTKSFLVEITKGTENVGFITDVVNGYPIFVDKSLVDYFSAKFLLNNETKYGEFLTEQNMNLPKRLDYFLTSMNSEKVNDCLKLITDGCKKYELTELVSKNQNFVLAVDQFGRNIIHYAVISGNREAVRFILLNDIFPKDDIMKYSSIYCELHIMFRNEVRSHLLASWFYEECKKHSQYNVYLRLILLSNYQIFYYFNQLASKDHPLHVAILDKHREAINSFIETNSDIEELNEGHMTPLHVAVYKRDTATIKALTKKGVEYRNDNIARIYPHQIWDNLFDDVTTAFTNSYAHYIDENINSSEIRLTPFCEISYPLHEAVRQKDLAKVEALIKTGNINCADPKGRTPLHVAAAVISWDFGVEIFNWLLQKSVKYKRDKQGYFPHDYVNDFLIRNMLCGYGFACFYENFPKELHTYFGGSLENIVRDEYFYESYVLGISAKISKVAPFSCKNKLLR